MIVDGVSHAFGDRTVLSDVHLEVPPGRVVGLLGPNGAGKTTLLRILFGVLAPDAGDVRWKGRAATVADRREWGYMPQERGLYRDMRMLDHLVWLAELHGLTAAEGRAKAEALLEDLGVAERAGDEIKELSGGMAQRVQLAAAMVHDPSVLVLDEPFAGLDPTAVGFLSDLVTGHAERGGHVLFSSHQLDLVEDLCETITMIDHGRVVLEGEVRELKEHSEERRLWVDIDVDEEAAAHAGTRITTQDASGTRVALPPGADALGVLDDLRHHAHITEFRVEGPTLSELFRDATGQRSKDAGG
ncbi:MAG: ATP-binding cassette domain-containing protein [Acidimicrobiales bacterium]|nr:ATP-binding cassette domain-containing protein [Acidimicrobiales bacterium]